MGSGDDCDYQPGSTPYSVCTVTGTRPLFSTAELTNFRQFAECLLNTEDESSTNPMSYSSANLQPHLIWRSGEWVCGYVSEGWFSTIFDTGVSRGCSGSFASLSRQQSTRVTCQRSRTDIATHCRIRSLFVAYRQCVDVAISLLSTSETSV